ncbi:MAG: hypothetical protein ABW098_18220 [Candidatus Thiodiazotropha sp.]
MNIIRENKDDRVDIARQFFEEGFSPEEWVARRSHTIMCWSLDEVDYNDPVLEQWILEVTNLMGLNGPPRSELRENI